MTDIVRRLGAMERQAKCAGAFEELRVYHRTALAIASLQVHRGVASCADGFSDQQLIELALSLDAANGTPVPTMQTLNRLAGRDGAIAEEFAGMKIREAVEAAAWDVRPLPSFAEASAVREKPVCTPEEAEARGGAEASQKEEAKKLVPREGCEPARVQLITRLCNDGEYDQLLHSHGFAIAEENGTIWWQEREEFCHAYFSDGLLTCRLGYRLADSRWSWVAENLSSGEREEGFEDTREAAWERMPTKIVHPDYAEPEYFGERLCFPEPKPLVRKVAQEAASGAQSRRTAGSS